MSEVGAKDPRPTVLVVEDEKPIRRLFQRLLEGEGYRVLTAENGVEGVQMTFEQTPVVVLTDIMMPEMDGLTFLRRVRSSAIRAVLGTARISLRPAAAANSPSTAGATRYCPP